jgi:hypothetical protein
MNHSNTTGDRPEDEPFDPERLRRFVWLPGEVSITGPDSEEEDDEPEADEDRRIAMMHLYHVGQHVRDVESSTLGTIAYIYDDGWLLVRFADGGHDFFCPWQVEPTDQEADDAT